MISGFEGSSGGLVEPLISERTKFFVIGKNEYGCLESDSIIIDPKDYDSLNFSVKPAIIEEEDRRVHFIGYTPKECTWYWYPGDGEREIVGNEVSYEYSEYDATTTDSFLVEVKAVDDLGCEYTGSSYVYVWKDFWAPNAFSPNGDGLNDVFKFRGGEFMENFTYIIYNRLGQVLFEGKSIDDVWNGKYADGQYCPQGVYGWVVNYSSTFKGIYKEAEKKGYVTIIK
jgi:gliding motility-associated-like protein